MMCASAVQSFHPGKGKRRPGGICQPKAIYIPALLQHMTLHFLLSLSEPCHRAIEPYGHMVLCLYRHVATRPFQQFISWLRSLHPQPWHQHLPASQSRFRFQKDCGRISTAETPSHHSVPLGRVPPDGWYYQTALLREAARPLL